MPIGPVTSPLNPFDDDVLSNPFPHYRELRDAGPVVWLEKHRCRAVARYREVRAILADHATYISGAGVSLTPPVNEAMKGSVLTSDPPYHEALRDVLSKQMSARALQGLAEDILRRADALVERLGRQGQFDAVEDLAKFFPVAVVVDLIGLPEEGRDRLLHWANAAFNCFGPPNDRTMQSLTAMQEMVEYATQIAVPGRLRPGSMGAAIYEAAERKRIKPESCWILMNAYLTAGLDTTINSISAAVQLFAENPAQWTKVRADPATIPNAYNEILRYESPVLSFMRSVARDHDLAGVPLKQGDWVMLFYASANRDERRWVDPDNFDVSRDAAPQIAFGYGIHGCAGQALARLEAHAVISALARRVSRFETGKPERRLNNVVRGLAKLPVRVFP